MHRSDRRLLARAALIGALTAGVLLAASARAEAGWRIDRSRIIANEVWGAPCAGTWDVQLRPPPGPDWLGWVYSGTCTVYLADELANADFYIVCSVILHEVGHVAGAGHSYDPANIMYPTVRGNSRCFSDGRPWLRRRGYIQRGGRMRIDFARLRPGDILTINKRGRVFRARFENREGKTLRVKPITPNVNYYSTTTREVTAVEHRTWDPTRVMVRKEAP